MLAYEYTAKEPAGGRVAGTLNAGSEREALKALDDRGLMPLSIRPIAPSKPLLGSGKRSVSGREMVRFYRQFSDLLRAGVPLLRGLELLERQSGEGALPVALAAVRKEVADGAGLAECMREHPNAFNELAVSMIKAGQEGGFLEDVLSRIADYTEREAELKGKVAGALAYPGFLFVVGSTVITVLVVFFVPKFGKIFARLEQKGQLPAITTGLLATSNFLGRYGVVLLAGAGAGAYGFARWRATPKGREAVDRAKITFPKVGDLFRNLALVRFTRVLGTMLANGIPILNALRIAKDSTGNVVLSRAIADAADNVTGGESLTEPLRASGHFPREMIEMVAIAEESNTLEKVLLDIADSTERRTTRQLDLVVRMLEPLMLLVMAAVTLVVVSALLLPVMKMSSALR